MSSNPSPEHERRGPSGLTTLELAALLPPLEPLPPVPYVPDPPTLWGVIPRLLLSIAVGVLALMHVGFFLFSAVEPTERARCLVIVDSVGPFVIGALAAALAGAHLLSRLKQALRNRRLRSPEPG